MFWIYIPPVVLVGAIIALVVILGKKSAELRKAGNLYAKQPVKNFSVSGKKDKWSKAGQQMLHILERILIGIKFAVKKSERSITGLVFRIRATREEKKSLEDSQIEDLVRSRVGEPETTEWVSSEADVVKKKRISEPVVRLKETPLAEDKVREKALIHRIAENPKDVEAYRELGDYYLSSGNIKDAKDSFKMVLKLRPRDLKAKSSLREIEMKMRLGN